MRTLSLALVALLSLALSGCYYGDWRIEPPIIGSGKMLTKDYSFADFQSVDIGSAFRAGITQAETYSVSITADDNLFDYIKVDKTGSQLFIRFDHSRGYSNGVVKIKITMPTLDELSLGGASTADVSGFQSSKAVNLSASGASTLNGSLSADSIALRVTGASKANLKGTTNSGYVTGDGASSLNLGDFTFDSASVRLDGATNATLGVKTKLDYSLSGASRLTYLGNPTIGNSHTSGASSATRR